MAADNISKHQSAFRHSHQYTLARQLHSISLTNFPPLKPIMYSVASFRVEWVTMRHLQLPLDTRVVLGLPGRVSVDIALPGLAVVFDEVQVHHVLDFVLSFKELHAQAHTGVPLFIRNNVSKVTWGGKGVDELLTAIWQWNSQAPGLSFRNATISQPLPGNIVASRRVGFVKFCILGASRTGSKCRTGCMGSFRFVSSSAGDLWTTTKSWPCFCTVV